MGLRVGDTLDGKYRIERELGRGGMGTVYEAHHVAIHRRVAVKMLKAALAVDDEMVHRFEREALAASSVRSKHVVEVFDVGALPSGERYMILEYLDGESLSQRLKRGGVMTPAEAFPLAAQLLDGLAAAHDAGIIHRDLKPANIYLCRADDDETLVKVLDFGVSKFSALGGEAFTQTGALVGTPHYMAPELTEGASKADARSDIYGVGAILFRALTGKTPYTAETIHELIAKLIRQDPKRLADVAPQISTAAAQIVDRALAKDPDQRFPDARSMAKALRDLVADPSQLTVHAPAVDSSSVSSGPHLTPPSHTQPSWREARPGRSPSPAALGQLSASGRGDAAPADAGPAPDSPSTLPSAAPHQSLTAATIVRPENAPEPPTLITPSPATIDSLAIPPKRSSKAWLVGVGLGAVLALGAGALLLGGSTAPSTAAAPPAPTPSTELDVEEPEPAPEASPSPEVSHTAASASAAPQATTTAGATKAKPRVSPPVTRPQPPPVRRPPRATPPPAPRDIREDL